MESQASANRSSFLSYSGSNPDCTAANKVILLALMFKVEMLSALNNLESKW